MVINGQTFACTVFYTGCSFAPDTLDREGIVTARDLSVASTLSSLKRSAEVTLRYRDRVKSSAAYGSLQICKHAQ